jgi:hypothetical protein
MAKQDRRDIVPTANRALSEALIASLKNLAPTFAPEQRHAPVDDETRIAFRADLIESPESDPTGYERIIGESDLTSINYLDRGRRAATAVCRIRVPSDGGDWFGTSFLVAPRLLITNHHVLASADEASQAEAEFGYEHDLDGVLQKPIQFNLRPHEIFFTDPELDEIPPVLIKIERRMEALLAEYGASDPGELSRALQGEILQRAILEAAVDFPNANRSFMHPAFIRAWERMWLATQGTSDAFAMTTGVYAAVVLAGFGLPVAPFDLVIRRILAKPSNDIDTVRELFSSNQLSSATIAVRRRFTYWRRIA